MLNQTSRCYEVLRNFHWPFETKKIRTSFSHASNSSFAFILREMREITDRVKKLQLAPLTFPGSSRPREITSLASVDCRAAVKSSQRSFSICIIKRWRKKEKNSRHWKWNWKATAWVFLTLSIQTRGFQFHVGAVRYYVSLHTSAASTFHASRSRLVFFLSFAAPFMCSPILYFCFFYTTYCDNQIGVDHDRICRKDVEDSIC